MKIEFPDIVRGDFLIEILKIVMHLQGGPNRSVHGILMRDRITKIDQNAISLSTGNKPTMLRRDFRTATLDLHLQIANLFWIKSPPVI